SLQRTRLHCSRVRWWHALHHCIALRIYVNPGVRLGCSCLALETISTHCCCANLKAT
ncbi:unnamed protein product, partial [Staurois parvus]